MEEDNMMLEMVSSLLQSQESLVQRVSKLEEINHELMRRSEIMRRLIDNLPYEVMDPRSKQSYQYPKFEKMEDTIRRIRDDGMSLARLGDGEFAIMRGIKRHEFQKIDDKLASRLFEVMESELPNLIIGIADNFGSLERFTDEGAHGVRMYMSKEMRTYMDGILDKDRIYADGYITRFYALMRDNNTDAPAKRLEMLKSLWDGRDVIMVEGAQTRLGVGNDLFDNTKSIRRILAPATNSFDRYDDILTASLKNAEKGDLFLIALGPSAGVLAYDLAKEGYQALDIGHIDLEYEWYLAGEGHRVAVPNKFNNEVAEDDTVVDVHDEVYEKQIVDRFD